MDVCDDPGEVDRARHLRPPPVRPRLGSRGLPPDVHTSWRASLATAGSATPRVLAWARSDDGYVLGSPAVLSVGVVEARDGAESAGDAPDVLTWQHVGWHEIEHGGWNAESRSLSWTRYGGRRGRVGLSAPGRVPELFRERVAASIVVERFVPIRGERGVTVTARRDLGGTGELTWHSTLTRGLSWSAEGVTEEAERATAELRSEYGSASSGW